ncbi:MAG TPA: hypothetical protein VN031_01375 [Candidatus Microsaccharimonas sp.]|nr:hypothetical protein [Candidatus Microsaccharimonas sp.]
MPAKSTSKSKRAAPAKAKRPVQKSRVVTSKKKSRLSALLASKVGMLIAAIIIGGAGVYLLKLSNAQTPLPPDNPGRGLYYSKMHSSPNIHGPCGDDFLDVTHGQSAVHSQACIHQDPGPVGVDVRARAQQIDAQLAAQVQYDKQHPDNPNVEPSNAGSDQVIANDLYAGTLSNVSGNHWPCVDTTTGYRIKLLYVYKAGNSDRIGGLRDNFESIARRVNAVMYDSSQQNGGQGRQYKFIHNADCTHLLISDVAVSGDMGDYSNIVNQLRAKGYNNGYIKYMAWVDSDTGCGQGSVYSDTRPTQDNPNNSGNSFALVWRGCWNYAEPHELMHTLGAVEPSAPYGTAGYHCYDQHDVMCYNDGTHSMTLRCTSTASYSRYDCGKDTYFNAATPSGWLATHWNTANSRFLTHY